MHLFLKLLVLVKHCIFRMVFLSIIRSSKLHIRQQAYVQFLSSWWWTENCPKHGERFTRIN